MTTASSFPVLTVTDDELLGAIALGVEVDENLLGRRVAVCVSLRQEMQASWNSPGDQSSIARLDLVWVVVRHGRQAKGPPVDASERR